MSIQLKCEDLGERDHWFAHGEYLTQAAIRVPLLIRVPGRAPSTRDDLVTLLDILPTIGALFAFDQETHLEGRDLFSDGVPKQGPALILTTGPEASSGKRVGVVKDGYKLVRTLEDGEEHRYRLTGEGEASAEPGEIFDELRSLLDRRLATFPEHPPPPPIQLTPDQYRELKAMGYIDD